MKVSSRPRAVLAITPELLVEICKGLQVGDSKRFYRVVEHGLPDDTTYVRTLLLNAETIGIELESEAFTDGETLMPVTLESIQADDAYREMRRVAVALLEYIDSIPKDVDLGTMPGIDRDWVEMTIKGECEGE